MKTKTFTRTTEIIPPKWKLIEWLGPTGELVRGWWQGKFKWKPEGSKAYVRYTPVFWRLI